MRKQNLLPRKQKFFQQIQKHFDSRSFVFICFPISPHAASMGNIVFLIRPCKQCLKIRSNLNNILSFVGANVFPKNVS